MKPTASVLTATIAALGDDGSGMKSWQSFAAAFSLNGRYD
jgi:hypothetical protein